MITPFNVTFYTGVSVHPKKECAHQTKLKPQSPFSGRTQAAHSDGLEFSSSPSSHPTPKLKHMFGFKSHSSAAVAIGVSPGSRAFCKVVAPLPRPKAGNSGAARGPLQPLSGPWQRLGFFRPCYRLPGPAQPRAGATAWQAHSPSPQHRLLVPRRSSFWCQRVVERQTRALEPNKQDPRSNFYIL